MAIQYRVGASAPSRARQGTLLVLLAVAPLAVLAAWQTQAALPLLGLSQPDLERAVRDAARNYSPDPDPTAMTPGGARKALKGLDEQRRAAVVREVGALTKTLVMSAGFQKAHAEHIRVAYNAVDHGIQAKSPEDLAAEAMKGKDIASAEAQAVREGVAQMAKELRSLPVEALKGMFDGDLASWTRQLQRASAAKRPALEKLVARAKEIEPWAASKPEEFKKAYTLLKSVEMGGPATEAELFSAAGSAADQQQQLAWNKFNLRKLLKQQLALVVATGSSVDFAAQTQLAGGMRRFVNPAYERKSNLWKAFYRAGKAPTQAAVDIAREWLKELGG